MFHIRDYFLFAIPVSFLLWAPLPAHARANTLALFNFRATNIEAMGHNVEILYALICALEKEKSINLMSRREMEETLHQSGLVQNDNPEMVLKAGKALGVNFILFGRVTKKRGQIIAQIKLMDVENASVLNTWDKTFSGREDILHKISPFAVELSGTIENRELNLSPSPPPKAQNQIGIHIDNLHSKSKAKTIVLSWKFDASQPVVGFNVYRAENPEGPYQFLGKTNKNIYNDATIKKGKYYYYHIGIILSSGKEIKDNYTAQAINMGEKLPHPPVIMSIKGYLQRTEIKFIPSLINDQEKFEIVKYKIYRQKNSSGEWENISSIDAEIRPQSGLAFTVEDTNNIGDGETYTYAIASLDKENRESPKSSPVAVKTISPPVLKVEKDDLLRKVRLSWQSLETIKGYCLYRKSNLEGWKRVARISGCQKSNFTDKKDLKDGQHYQYYLTTYDAERETGPSNMVKAKTKDLPPIPENLQAQSGLVKSVQISWAPVEDPDIGGYAIYRGTDREKLIRIAKVKGYKSDSFLDKGKAFQPLENGKDYYYSVTCFNLFGAEGKKTYASLARTKPRPSNVKGLMATATQGHIFLRWDNNPEPDIKGYILFRNRNNGYWSKVQTLSPDQTSYKDVDLKPDSSYRYRIIAVDNDDLKSDPVESNSVPSPVVKSEE
ncbi:MAG: fibronectin type III domain-containing protein [Deltaproteobacteria bacterium]|nr:fibronectin type III domain-containing protein [Deltaproteobacteria bacterium]